jgi:tetratricopeptide (TPR) repeat protein
VPLLFPLVVAKSLSKELKKPDEFVSFWTHLGATIAKYRRQVITALAVVLVSGLLGWGVTVYRNGKAAKATAAFARIDAIASAELLPEKGADKTVTAEAPDSEAGSVPRFKTAKERLEAAVKEADAFLATYGAEGIGRRVLFDKAGRLLVLGNAGEAGTIYETLAANESNPDLKELEREGVGAAAEAAGKLDDALRVYSSLADEAQHAGNFYLDRALFAKARILEKQGKAKDAEKVLREILDKLPKTGLRQQIDDRLAILTEK